MRRLLLIMLSVLLISSQLLAQNRTITGTVTDNQGKALPNVSVQVKGTTLGTVTGADGSYSISVPATAKVLVFSSVDMGTREITIGTQSRIPVSLQPSDRALQEVVVTGYTRERRTNFTGAATVINARAVENVPVSSFDQALQGRAPGLLVNSGNGQPGASPGNIRIRGTSSLGGQTQPLYIVDGVPLAAADMATINPNDFESITVLKDASASALYGARGGLGVIVITTKRGKAGQTQFSVRSQYGFTQRPQASQFTQMTSAEMLRYEEFVGRFASGLTAPGWVYSANNPANAALPATSPANNPFAASKARYQFILDSLAGNNVDYYDLLFRTGVTQSHEVTMRGGNGQTNYFMSFNNFNQEGTDRKSKLNRYTMRFNLDNTVGKLTTGFNGAVGYSVTDFNEGAFYGGSGTANPFAMVWRAKPYENPYDRNGNLIFGPSTALVPKALGNLIERSNNSTWKDRQLKVNAGLNIAWRVIPTLTLKHTVGVDGSMNTAQGWINANSYVGTLQSFQAGYLNESQFHRVQLINTSSAIWANRFANRHEVELGAYFETVRQWNRGAGFSIYNLDPRLPQTGQNAGTLTTGGAASVAQNGSSASSGFGIRSYFATARYTLDNKYTLSGNVRRDGTSRIIKEENKQLTTFSLGVTWNAIKESFLENQGIFTDLRVRANYGEVPNIGSIPGGSYGLGSNFYSVANYWSAQLPAFSAVNTAGSPITGLVPSAVNEDLRIERIRKINAGIDMGFWANRIRLSVDAYEHKTIDLFVRQRLVASSGFYNSSLNVNAGTLSNKGLEFDLNVDLIRTNDMDLTLRANHSINKNRIVSLGGVTEYTEGTGIIKVGLPAGTHYSYAYLGADPATGRPIYKRPDGTPTTNIGEAGQFHEFGSWVPVHQGGFGLTFRYKQLSIEPFFTYQADVRRYNNIQNWVTQGDATYTGAVTQSNALFTEQWTKPGDVRMLQSPAFSRQFTSYDITDASFLRFRNLNITYNIPEVKVGKTRIFRSATFYIQGQNLWIWSPWSGLDPEDDNNISLAEFPNPRAVVVGAQINF